MVSVLDGKLHFIDTEISLRTNHHSTLHATLQDIHQERLVSTFSYIFLRITMADEFVAFSFLLDEALEGSHPVQDWLPCLMTLLHRRNEDFIDTLFLYDASLAELAVKESQLVETNLGGFFSEPLHTVVEFCRCHCQMDMTLPSW